jgi:glutaredoxin
LEAFDRAGTSVLPRRALHDALAGSSGALCAEICDGLLAHLVRDGLLATMDNAASFRRTEAGRLALAGPLDMTLYTRPGCHLCEEMKAQLAPLVAAFGARIREVDVDEDPALQETYGCDVPVLFLGSRRVAKHRLDVRQLRRQMEAARGISR